MAKKKRKKQRSRKLQKQRPEKQRAKVKLLTLFVDPASVSSGWALFSGQELVKSGTILVDKKKSVGDRLDDVYQAYRNLDFDVDEVHVEDVPRSRTCHIYVHYSIGVILAALSSKATVQKVDIPVNSWQKYVEWDRENKNDAAASSEERLQAFKGRARSRDELAAVSMGLWYTED